MVPGLKDLLARRRWLVQCGCLGFAALAGGCSQPAMRSQNPDDFEKVLKDVRLVGDVSLPFGIHPLSIESVGLVTNLANTGRDLPPSPVRAMLIAEMQRRGVEHPNKVLERPTTSAVMVRADLKPGLESGDRFDVEVTLPRGSETTSLKGGMLLEARLREIAMGVADQQLHHGHVFGLAKGPLLIDPLIDEKKENARIRARIIEGGIALQNRPLGLMIKPEHRSVQTAAAIGESINRRFFVRPHGIKKGVAVPKTDRYIELAIHPIYKDNVPRYFQVVRSLPTAETTSQRQVRMQLLERQLFDSVTAASAAVRLEAIGPDAVEILKRGNAAPDAEVRFYAAEALAYLNESCAAATLAVTARDNSALRARALAALSAMDDPLAHGELVNLMDCQSAETRYGAFRALWAMNPRDAAIRGQMVANQFSVHHVRCKGPSGIHITRAYRPEVVLFGAEHPLRTPLLINTDSGVTVRDIDGGRLSVTRFAPGESDQKREIGATVNELVQAVAAVGGTYPDVVQALIQAKKSGAIATRVDVDAVPKTDRIYQPEGETEEESEEAAAAAFGEQVSHGYQVDGPSPNLYPAEEKPVRRPGRTPAPVEPAPEEAPEAPAEEGGVKWPASGPAGKMRGRTPSAAP